VLAGGGAVAVLARAQRRTAMGVCAFVDLPDQSHLLLRPIDVEQLSRFLAYVDAGGAGQVGRLGRWRERLRRCPGADVVLGHEPEEEERRLRHLLIRGIDEGLLAPPGPWTGGEPLVDAGGGEILELSPLPAWDALAELERRARVERLAGLVALLSGTAREALRALPRYEGPRAGSDPGPEGPRAESRAGVYWPRD